MKITHRIIALLLCLLMVGSGSLMVLAEETGDDIVIIESEPCAECGAVDHLETCSQYVVSAPVICVECGLADGAHADTCSQYVAPAPEACAECGMEEGHADTCSQYVAPAPVGCAECGMEEGHADTCSQYVAPAPVGCAECGMEEGHADTCSQYVAPAPVGCVECGMEEGHADTCSQYVAPVLSVFEQLNSAASLEDFRSVMMAEENREAVLALTVEEIETLITYVNGLYVVIAEPTEDEIYTHEELIETLNYLPAMECPECGEFGTHAEDCVKNIEVLPGGGTAKGTMTGADFMSARNASNVVKLTGDTTITSQIVVAAGQALVLDLNGYVLISAVPDTHSFISCSGTLTIKSSNSTRAHRGSMVQVTRWVDKRTNYSTYGSQWNTTAQSYDRYIQVTTADAEMWVYDKTGSTIIYGGIITGAIKKNGSGAAIYVNGGTLNLQSGTIAGNSSLRNVVYDASKENHLASTPSNPFGGAVYALNSAVINMSGGAICYNWCDYYGGGVCLNSGSIMNMTSGVITENCAQGSGGGIGVREGSTFNLGTDSSVNYSSIPAPVISYNRTFDVNYMGGGGGIEVTSAALNYQVGSIMYNHSSGSGAGIYCYRGGSVNASTANSVISNNYAGGSGGAIFLQYGDVNLNGCILNDNESKSSAGAVGIRVGNFIMTGGEIKNNKSNSNGGAVYVTAQNNITPHGDPGNLGCSASITGTTISGNYSANYGGAVYVNVWNSTENCTVNLTNCQIIDNEAKSRGGAAYICGGTLTVDGANTVVEDNTAPNGGAFYVEESDRTSTSLAKNSYVYRVIKEGWKDFDTLTDEDVERITDPAIARKPAIVYIKAGTFETNSATTGNGGVFYVTGTNSEVTMSGGTLTTNTAAVNGGAIYVKGGNFTMNGGTMTLNGAKLGGSVYVSGGNVIMNSGTMSYNKANNGGAVYITGGNFDMISGKLLNNGSQSDTVVTEYGGAVYVDGGNITIGVKNCTGAGGEGGKHTSTHKDKAHPIIKENKAQYGGAFAVRGTNDSEGNAIKGKVTVYCSFIDDNEADNEGTGHNIFMDGGGLVHYLNSAEIGTSENHDIVTIGGQLQVVKDGQIIEIKLVYDSNVSAIEMQWTGKAPEGYHLNLPYCPKDWQETQAKPENGSKAFVGWSHVPTNSNLASEVRSKGNYLPVGSAIEVEGDEDNKMVFYAVWAPYTNNVSYGYSIDGENISAVTDLSVIGIATSSPSQFKTYNYANVSYNFGLTTPSIPGYEFKGWHMYADTDLISNWNADPENKLPSSQVTLVSQIDDIATKWNGKIDRNFGDITLVAVFIPQYTDLRITNTAFGARSDQVFQYEISGKADDVAIGDYSMVVTIQGSGSILISQIPVGDYTVTQLNTWSWRYGANTSQSVDLNDPETVTELSFTSVSSISNWLSGDSFEENVWGTANNN